MEQQNSLQEVNSELLPSSTLAIVSLVSAILGFTALPGIGAIVAIVTGYMARGETRSIPPKASGDGMATAGIIMGWVQVGLFVTAICCGIAALVLGISIFAASGR